MPKEISIEQQIAAAYKASEAAMQEDLKLKAEELDIAIRRKTAHQAMLVADERLWVLRHQASGHIARQ